MSTKKNKFSIYIYVVITIIGCVLACSSIVPNDYLKLVVVMGALGVGLYGIMHSFHNGRNSQPRKIKDRFTA
jgi:uncharacterized MnhB-related membrane protein